MCENIYFRFFLLISTSVDIHTWTKSQSHPSTGDEELWEKITWLIWTCSMQFKARQEPEVARESNNEPGGEDNTCGHTPPRSLLAPSSNLKWDMRHSEKQAAYCQFVIGSVSNKVSQSLESLRVHLICNFTRRRWTCLNSLALFPSLPLLLRIVATRDNIVVLLLLLVLLLVLLPLLPPHLRDKGKRGTVRLGGQRWGNNAGAPRITIISLHNHSPIIWSNARETRFLQKIYSKGKWVEELAKLSSKTWLSKVLKHYLCQFVSTAGAPVVIAV